MKMDFPTGRESSILELTIVPYHLIDFVEAHLVLFAERLPLGMFVFVGSLIEEIVSPIPPALVVGIAGSIAQTRDLHVAIIFLLVALACTGKTLGAAFYYLLGDKLEDIIVPRFGRFVGVTHADMERMGARFSGNHWKDGGALFLFRALPFMPSTVVSLAAGVFKMNRLVYLGITATGYFLKDLYFIALGYIGYGAFRRVVEDVDRLKIVVDVMMFALFAGVLILLYRHRRKGAHAWRFLCRLFDRVKNGGSQ